MDNRAFWNLRYETLPALGSGPGSRGYASLYKRDLLLSTIAEYRIRSVVDIGCGDLCWLDPELLQKIAYAGFDISEEIVARNKLRFPALNFRVLDISREAPDPGSDLVVCFDVLIHQIERPRCIAAIRNIVQSIGKVGVISYLTPPSSDSEDARSAEVPSGRTDYSAAEQAYQEMLRTLPADRAAAETKFHGPLPELIAEIDGFEAIEIGRYRYQSVYLIRRVS